MALSMCIPPRRIFFWDAPAPESIWIRSAGREKYPESNLTIARLAFPSTGGSRILQPMLFLQALYPEGNLVRFAFGVTSIESIVPSLLAVRALRNSFTQV